MNENFSDKELGSSKRREDLLEHNTKLIKELFFDKNQFLLINQFLFF